MICPHCKNSHDGKRKSCDYCLATTQVGPWYQEDSGQSSSETGAVDAYTENLKDQIEAANSGGWIE